MEYDYKRDCIAIQKGIYQYDKDMELKGPSDIPLIIVHPFYNEGETYTIFNDFFRKEKAISSRLSKPTKDYRKNLIKLVKQHKGVRIVLEEPDALNERTLDFFKKQNKQKGTYFIPTHLHDPEPLLLYEDPWDTLSCFIKQFGKEVDLAGGRIWRPNKSKDYFGCVPGTYRPLKKRGIKPKFVKHCCFR